MLTSHDAGGCLVWVENPIKEKELQSVINSQVLDKTPVPFMLAGQDQGHCCRAMEGFLLVHR